MLAVTLFQPHAVPRFFSTKNSAVIRPSLVRPTMRHRQISPAARSWPSTPHMNYYYDAGRQTIKALRVLIKNNNEHSNDLGIQPITKLLTNSFENLLMSLRPGLQDDAQSCRQFTALLRMHLAGLTRNELSSLSQTLKSSRFMCYVTESVIDDETYLEYGFSNGPPHCSSRMLLQTSDLYRLLDELKQTAAAQENPNTESAVFTPEQAQEARDVLADSAQFWMQSDNSLEVLQDTACRLAMALDIKTMPQTTIVAEPGSSSSTVGWNNHQLVLDPKTASQLSSGKNDLLYARVLRDVLELLISLKLTGRALQPNQLTSSERSKVLNLLERITEQSKPSSGNVMLHQQARAVMKHSAQFGQIQIKPGAGGSLGHAWIAPRLSLVPDKLVPPHEIGKRYMHTGLNLAPDDTTIRAWSPKFLTEKENEQIHPADSAWHLTVPVNMLRLQEAAKETVQEWQENKVPYRFIGTEPGMSATGCRMTVWHAIEQSMEPDALALFKHYNRGLPEPDSPTELWIRMHGLMEWIEQLARS